MAAGARTRQKKLSTKQTLSILREGVDTIDEDAQDLIPTVETGVEKGEEIVCLFTCTPIFVSLKCPNREHHDIYNISRWDRAESKHGIAFAGRL
jgi:hypothetical protein